MVEHAASPHAWVLNMLVRGGLLLGVTLVCNGCATVTTVDGERLALTSNEFANYVERVFREQNRVADALAFALEGAAGRADLMQAEQSLLTACAGVNELATARRDGESLGFRRSAANARSVPECERAAQEAARVLPRS
jgi:hypothetical protein